MEVLHTLCVAAASIAITGLIVWCTNSCSLQETALREACIKNGGSVIRDGTSFHCIRIGGAAGGS